MRFFQRPNLAHLIAMGFPKGDEGCATAWIPAPLSENRSIVAQGHISILQETWNKNNMPAEMMLQVPGFAWKIKYKAVDPGERILK